MIQKKDRELFIKLFKIKNTELINYTLNLEFFSEYEKNTISPIIDSETKFSGILSNLLRSKFLILNKYYSIQYLFFDLDINNFDIFLDLLDHLNGLYCSSLIDSNVSFRILSLIPSNQEKAELIYRYVTEITKLYNHIKDNNWHNIYTGSEDPKYNEYLDVTIEKDHYGVMFSESRKIEKNYLPIQQKVNGWYRNIYLMLYNNKNSNYANKYVYFDKDITIEERIKRIRNYFDLVLETNEKYDLETKDIVRILSRMNYKDFIMSDSPDDLMNADKNYEFKLSVVYDSWLFGFNNIKLV